LLRRLWLNLIKKDWISSYLHTRQHFFGHMYGNSFSLTVRRYFLFSTRTRISALSRGCAISFSCTVRIGLITHTEQNRTCTKHTVSHAPHLSFLRRSEIRILENVQCILVQLYIRSILPLCKHRQGTVQCTVVLPYYCMFSRTKDWNIKKISCKIIHTLHSVSQYYFYHKPQSANEKRTIQPAIKVTTVYSPTNSFLKETFITNFPPNQSNVSIIEFHPSDDC
jgi:hypothetical protein